MTEAEQGDGCTGWTTSAWKRDRSFNWRNTGFSQGDDHPVVCVSWNDAKAYVQWMAQKTGKPYRLLSEAEREYATRVGSTSTYWWGEAIGPDKANYGLVSGKFTTPAGRYPVNPLGLYDMSGNTWDWVEDGYHENYTGAPSDGSAWVSGGASLYRVLRGGSWYSDPAWLRSSNRIRFTPGARDGDVGFRVARILVTP